MLVAKDQDCCRQVAKDNLACRFAFWHRFRRHKSVGGVKGSRVCLCLGTSLLVNLARSAPKREFGANHLYNSPSGTWLRVFRSSCLDNLRHNGASIMVCIDHGASSREPRGFTKGSVIFGLE